MNKEKMEKKRKKVNGSKRSVKLRYDKNKQIDKSLVKEE